MLCVKMAICDNSLNVLNHSSYGITGRLVTVSLISNLPRFIWDLLIHDETFWVFMLKHLCYGYSYASVVDSWSMQIYIYQNYTYFCP